MPEGNIPVVNRHGVESVVEKLCSNYHTSSKYNNEVVLIYEDIKKNNFKDFHLINAYSTYVMANLWKKRINGKLNKHTMACLHGDFFTEQIAKSVAFILQSINRTQNK